MVSAIFGIGGGIGLPLSGVVVDILDTRWLFWINLSRCPPRSPRTGSSRRRRRRRARGSTGSAPRSCPSRSAAILLGVSEADDVGLGLAGERRR